MEEPKELVRPQILSRWRHADGGVYKVLLKGGTMKDDATGKWVPSVTFDHADGTLGPDAPYTTSLKRWHERFTPASATEFVSISETSVRKRRKPA